VVIIRVKNLISCLHSDVRCVFVASH